MMRAVPRHRFPTTLALVALAGLPLFAQSGDAEELRQEIESLKAGQAEIKDELAEIKKLIAGLGSNRAAPSFKPTKIDLTGSPILGDPRAKVTLVEFTDLQCPFCSRHYKNTVPELLSNFVDTGKIRYIVREFPLTSIHPRAARASEAALCAGEQGKYWEMHGRIFDSQKAMADADFAEHADILGLEKAAFESCLATGRFAERVKQDVLLGSKAGVSGTPSFVVGLSDPNDGMSFTATEFIRGAQPFASFETVINKLLEEADDVPAGTE